MSKKNYLEKNKNMLGVIVASVGAGLLIAMIIPIWGWIIAVGGALIYVGWYLIEHCHK